MISGSASLLPNQINIVEIDELMKRNNFEEIKFIEDNDFIKKFFKSKFEVIDKDQAKDYFFNLLVRPLTFKQREELMKRIEKTFLSLIDFSVYIEKIYNNIMKDYLLNNVEMSFKFKNFGYKQYNYLYNILLISIMLRNDEYFKNISIIELNNLNNKKTNNFPEFNFFFNLKYKDIKQC